MAGERGARTPPDRNTALPGGRRKSSRFRKEGGGRRVEMPAPVEDQSGNPSAPVPRLRTGHGQRSAGRFPPPISRLSTLARTGCYALATITRQLREKPKYPRCSVHWPVERASPGSILCASPIETCARWQRNNQAAVHPRVRGGSGSGSPGLESLRLSRSRAGAPRPSWTMTTANHPAWTAPKQRRLRHRPPLLQRVPQRRPRRRRAHLLLPLRPPSRRQPPPHRRRPRPRRLQHRRQARPYPLNPPRRRRARLHRRNPRRRRRRRPPRFSPRRRRHR